MAYNSTGTPRFIIDYLSWWKSKGLIGGGYIWNGVPSSPTDTSEAVNNVIGLNPSNQTIVSNIDVSVSEQFNYNTETNFNLDLTNINVVGILGHNFSTVSEKDSASFAWDFQTPSGEYKHLPLTDDFIINASIYINRAKFGFDGFSFVSTTGSTDGTIVGHGLQPNFGLFAPDDYNKEFKLGSIIYGRQYVMPHSANLDISMSFEMDGIKTSETLGGSTLVNRRYTQAPMWGDLGAWELGSSDLFKDRDLGLQGLRRSGRRVWNLSFSYLQDSDVFPEISSLTNFEHYQPTSGESDGGVGYDGDYYWDGQQEDEGDGFSTNSARGYTLNTQYANVNFISEVLNKTNGGVLPFVFQPDSNDNTNFAIASIDQESISFKQVANGVYDIKLKIREVW